MTSHYVKKNIIDDEEESAFDANRISLNKIFLPEITMKGNSCSTDAYYK